MTEQNKELQLVGKVKEAHGLNGDLYILVFSGETEWLSGLKELQLSKDEGKSFKPLALGKIRIHKGGFILKSSIINDRTQAESYKGDLVYIPRKALQSKPGENIYLSEIEGFEVWDEKLELLGQIEAFGYNGVQDLIVIHKDGELVAEIPLIEPFIKSIDFEKKILKMSLPEGLVGEEE